MTRLLLASVITVTLLWVFFVTARCFLVFVDVKHLQLVPNPHTENNAAVNALHHILN